QAELLCHVPLLRDTTHSHHKLLSKPAMFCSNARTVEIGVAN
ncbi:MAG: hypothetical protein ACI9UU_003837, partial [Candidatus Azotimanducaceae bacterium]